MTAYNFYGTESPKQRSLKKLNMTQNNQKKSYLLMKYHNV